MCVCVYVGVVEDGYSCISAFAWTDYAKALEASIRKPISGSSFEPEAEVLLLHYIGAPCFIHAVKNVTFPFAGSSILLRR